MIFIEKYEFTYQHYLHYIYSYKRIKNGYLAVFEDSEEYILDDQEEIKVGDKKHDKIFKEILQNKEEMSKFINKFTKYEIGKNDLEIYNPNYITTKYEYKNGDIVYKVKEEEIYFLVEHQTKVDYSMAYRILNYCIEIIRDTVKNRKINRSSYRYPKVIPIVLYTENQNWTASTSYAKLENKGKNIQTNYIDLKYKLIDVNKYKTEELLQENTMLANAMILEKCRDNVEVAECLQKIVKNIKGNNKQLENLKRIVSYLYNNIEEKTKLEIIKLIEESESEENMSTIAERIGEEFANERKIGISQGISQGMAQGITQGIAQGIKQIIEQMIKLNYEDIAIKQVTGVRKSEIIKIRKEMSQM